jgi:hypothetical protein
MSSPATQSLYTGVYAKGGPTNVDMDPTNLAGLCDRSSADVRGVKTTSSNPGSRRTTTEGKIPAARRSTAESASGALASGVKHMKI